MINNYKFLRACSRTTFKSVWQKKVALLLFFVFSSVLGVNAQVATNGGSGLAGTYPSLSAAITALNAATISSPVVITLTGNETSPAGGYNITATGTSTNTITIQGSSSTITAPTTHTAGSLVDALFKITGGDWITIQNFTMLENASNTVTTAASNTMTEFGVALFYATTTNGAQNCKIQNNTITLNRTYQNTFGIYSNSTHSATSITVSATGATGGSNSGLKVYGNTISNINHGILIIGPTAAANFNTGIDIGGTASGTGNTISNFGTTVTGQSGFLNVSTTINGIVVRNSTGFNVSYNSITSSNGGISTAGTTLRGIFIPAASIAPTGTFANNINNNTIALTHGFTSGTIQGITVEATTGNATSTQNINNNNFTALRSSAAATSGTITAISNVMPNLANNFNGNTFTNISTNTTGSFTFFGHSYTMPAGSSQTFDGNSIVTAFGKTGAGGTVTVTTTNGSSVLGTAATYTNNNFSNITVTGATGITGFNNTDGGVGSVKTITGNTFNNWTGGTSAVTPMNFTYFNGTSTLSSNTVTNITGQSTVTGINIGSAASGTLLTVASNTINNLSSTGLGAAVTGISCSNASTTININGNAINTLSSTGPSAVTALSIGGGATTNIFQNKIYNILGSNASSTVNGILISAGLNINTYNNIIGDLRATAASGNDVIRGINITSTTALSTQKVYGNTVYLNAASSGANFGSTGLFHTYSATATSSSLDMRNNIIVNASSAAGTGLAVAFRRSAATDLLNYATSSNNNMFFGTSGLFTDGTNTDISLSAFQTRVSTRESASKSQNPSFASTTGADATFLHFVADAVNLAGSNGQVIAGYTTDFDGDTRDASTPDIGADEWVNGSISLPTVASFTPGTICLAGGQTVTITGTGLSTVTSVLFNSASGVDLPGVITASTATTLTVTTPANTVDGIIRVTNPAGSADSAAFFATVGAPTIGVSAAVAICSGTSTTLTATGGASYAWSPATGLSAATGDTVTANPTSTRTYTVTGSSAAGCTATNTVVVTVNPTPTAVTLSKVPAIACLGGTTTLTAAGGLIGLPGTATIGTATTLTTANGTEPTAFNNRYKHYWMQMVFTPAELNAAGVSAGNITSVKFTITTIGDGANVTDLKVRMGAAPAGTLTGFQSTGLTLVKTSATYTHAVGVNTLTFDTPYAWDGTSNLLFDLRSTGVDIANNAITYYTATTGNTVVSAVTSTTSSSDGFAATSPIGTASVKRLNTTFDCTVSSPAVISWSPTTDLFTDSAATSAYTGTDVRTVYSKSTTAQTYTASATLGSCSATSAGITVTPNPLPTINVASVSICNGGSTALAATGASTYVWSPATGLSATTGDVVTANPTVTTVYTISGTDSNGCINTTTATVTVNEPVAITSQPTNAIVTPGSDATFTVAASGTGLGYQWEENSGSGFAPISGATSASLTVSGVTLGMNGYSYRCVVSGTAPCASVTSAERTITVSNISIAAQPVNQTVCSNTSATFTISATGATSYQWQVNTGSGWSDVSGETGVSLVLSGITSANSGASYRILLNGGSALGGVDSDSALLTVYDVVAIATQPQSATVCSNAASVTFSATVTGSGLVYQWQLSTDSGASWNDISGATAADYTITSPGFALNGRQYKLNVSGTSPCSPVTSDVVTLTVNQLVSIATQPTAVNFCSPLASTANFSIVANGTGLTYQWVANNGSDITLVDDADFSGATTASLTVATPGSYNGYTFKCIVSGTAPCAAVTSNAVALNVLPIMGGTKTVGTGGDYATLTAAVAAYNAATCFSGPVVFNLTDATYSTAETFPIVINSNANAGTNTLTIKPSATATITGSTTSGIIKLNGADYVIIDGSNSGSTDKSLTIENTNVGTSSSAVWIGSLTLNGATNNTVKNIIAKGNAPTTTLAAIMASSGTTAGSAAEAANTNLTIQNNTVMKAQYGIGVVGNATYQTGTVISGNTVGSDTAAEYIGFRGIFVSNVDAVSVTNNTIFKIIRSAAVNVSGIEVTAGVINGSITGNRIYNIKSTSTSGYGAYGINFSSATGTTGVLVANNMISNIETANYSTTSSQYNAFGIRIAAVVPNLKIYNNTVHLFGAVGAGTSAGMSAAFCTGAAVTGLDVRNNIFNNVQTFGTTGSFAYAVYLTSGTTFANINYNDYSGTSGTNTTFRVGGVYSTSAFSTTGYADLAAWKVLTTQDAQSISVSPVLNSNNDLHLSTSANIGLDNLGTPIAAVTTDFDGDARSATTPDMGADEFAVAYCADPAVAGTVSATPSSLCTTGSAVVSATGYSIGIGSTYEWEQATDLAFTTPVSMGAATAVYASKNTGTITSTTYYRLKSVCNAGTVVYSTPIAVVVNTPAVTTVSSGVTICTGASTALTANGSSTYAWSPTTGLSAATGSEVTATPSATTTYTVTGTDANGCTTTATTTVTVNAFPSAVTVAQGAASVCADSVMSLTASGGTVSSSGSGKLGSGTATNTASTPYKGYYGGNKTQQLYTAAELTALGLSAGGTINSIGFVVLSGATNVLNGFSVNAGFVADATLGTAFIAGASNAVFTGTTYTPPTAAGNIDYVLASGLTWNGTSNLLVETCFNNNNGGGISTNDLSVESSTVASGLNLYKAQDNIADVCTNTTAPTTSTNRPNLRMSYTNVVPTTMTWSPTTALYTDAAATIAYTGQNVNVVYTKPSSSITYTATASNGSCTTSSAGTTITPIALPSFTLTPVTICNGNSTTIVIPESGYGYSWSPATGLDTTSGATVVANPTVTTTYTVVATDIISGCQKTETVVVTVNNAPAISSISPITNNVAIGQATSFTVAATGTGLTYQWQVDDSTGMVNVVDDANYGGATSATLSIASPTAEMNGYLYQCIVSGTEVCTPATSDAATLSVDTTGITTQPSNASICSGSSTSFITVASSVDPEQEITYAWEVKVGTAEFVAVADGFDATTGLTFSGAETGTLGMSGTTVANSGLIFHAIVNGYIFSSDATLTVSSPVAIETQPSNQSTCAANGTVTFSVAASNVGSYAWEVSSDSGASWSAVSGATTASLVITNPAASMNGNLYRAALNGISPCTAVTSDVATLTVINPTVTANPVAASIVNGNAATFAVTASEATTYQWQYSLTLNGTYTNVITDTPAGASYSGATSSSLTVNTTLGNTPLGAAGYYRCVASNGSCSATSTGALLTVVFYCTPAPSSVDASGITNVSLGTIVNATGAESGNYGDYTTLSTSVAQLSSVNFGITYATGYTYGTRIWIDYNDDADFTDVGELVYSGVSTATNPTTLSGTIAIPLATPVGAHRLRIGGTDDETVNNPCYTGTYGTYEDYTIVITAAPQCSGTPVAGTASAVSSILCAGNSASLTLNGYTSSLGINLQWYASTNNVDFAPIAGQTSATLATEALSANAYYYCAVTCTNSSETVNSNTVSITVFNPLITGSTPAGRCGTGTVALAAEANAGSTINWYAEATGGASLGTGTTFTTPSIAATTTYYAEAFIGDSPATAGATYTGTTTNGTSTGSHGIAFTTTDTNIKIESAKIPFTGTGTFTVALRNSTNGTTFSTVTTSSVTGSGATPVTVPLNITVPTAGSYTLILTGISGTIGGLGYSTGTYPSTALGGTFSVTGGYWFGAGTTNMYFFDLSVSKGCSSARTAVTATVTPQPTATISYTTPLCSTAGTASVTLNGTNAYTGGTYTSTAGLTLNGSTGAIDVATSTPGTYSVTYSIPDSGFCSGLSATTSVTINQALTSDFAYDAVTYCSNQGVITPTISGTAGTFTVSPSGLTLNGTTGAITLATSTAGTYTVTNTVVVAGCANSVTTATVTVNTAVAISSQPASVSKLPAENTSFAVTASGTGLAYQWQVNTGSGWSNLSDDTTYAGTSTATLSLTAVTAGMDQYQYQVIVSGATACAPVTSSAATLTVNDAAISAQPANFTACNEGANNASFAISTTGTAISYQWQVNTGSGFVNLSNAGVYSGADTATLSLTGVDLTYNNYTYRCVVNGVVNSNAATLSVKTAVAITTQPSNTAGCSAGSASFTVAASGSDLSYQWRVSTDGTTWNNVSGATSATLTLNGLTAGMNGYQYQAVVSGASPCAAVTSSAVTLTVNTAVAVTTQPVASTICLNGTTSFTVVASGTTPTYTWEENTGSGWALVTDGGVYSNATTATLAITGATLTMNGYQYRAIVSGASPCGSVTSSAVALTISQPAAPIMAAASIDVCAGVPQLLSVTNPTLGTSSTIITSGTGTSSTSGAVTGAGLSPNPMQSYYGGTRQQTLYTAAELTALGITNGAVLSSVAINLSAVETRALQNYTVKMKNTTTTTFATSTFETGATTVRNAASYQPVVGWNTLALDSNFTYTGGSLIVEFTFSNADGGGSGTNVATYNTTTNTATLYYRADSTSAATVAAATTATYSQTRRNNMQFGVLSASTTWSPTTGLFTDAAGTIAYTGGGAANVYAKVNSSATYTATNVNGLGCTNASTVSVNVATPSTLGSITQPSITCSGAQTTFNLTGLLPNSTSTISYNVNGGATQTVAAIVADASGNATFTRAFSGINNGQTFTLTAIQRTDVTPSCSTAISANNTVVISVQPTVTYFADTDGDGFGNIAVTNVSCQGQPAGYVTNSTDCDDTDAAKNATFTFYADVDGDTYGAGSAVTLCAVNASTPPSGYSVNNTDCDDADATKNATFTFYADVDGDTYGAGSAVTLCAVNASTPPSGYVVNNTDCDDTNINIYQFATFYVDVDGDGYDAGTASVCSGLTAPAGYAATTSGTDCNDADNAKYQTSNLFTDADGDGYTVGAATAVCYGAAIPSGYAASSLGTDCDDTSVSITSGTTFYADADNDTFGDLATTSVACTQPSGYVTNSTDCDPTDATKWQFATFYVDADADGYDNGTASVCSGVGAPTGYSAATSGTDCDDNNNLVYQSNTLYADVDGDTYTVGTGTVTCYGASLPAGTTLTQSGNDCDDNDNLVYQSNALYTDADGDGWAVNETTAPVCYGATVPTGYVLVSLGIDCNDTNALLTNNCGGGSVVNLTLFVQGYYAGGSTMTSVKLNQDYESPDTDVEDMTIELHDAVDYSLVDTAIGTLKTDGTLSVTFNTAAAGSYYIAVKGSNLVQTWSAAPQAVGTTPLNYDFSTSASQAYGDNMLEVEPGVFAMYQGDFEVDDLVDLTDYSVWDAKYLDFAFGVEPTDLNGDGLVDLSDYSIWEINYLNFIFASYPF